jgi:hypothetical protein
MKLRGWLALGATLLLLVACGSSAPSAEAPKDAPPAAGAPASADLLSGTWIRNVSTATYNLYEAPIDDAYSVRATVSHSMKSRGICCTSLFRLFLVDRADASRYWELAAISEAYEYRYAVRRATRSSVIIERTDSDYGISYGFSALFFDVRSKALLKQIDFKPDEALKLIESEEALRVGLDAVVFSQIKGAP